MTRTITAVEHPAGTVTFRGCLTVDTGYDDGREPAVYYWSPHYRTATDARRWVGREARLHPAPLVLMGEVFEVEWHDNSFLDDEPGLGVGWVTDTTDVHVKRQEGDPPRSRPGRWSWGPFERWED